MNHFDYSDGQTTFEGYWAQSPSQTGKRPCVLVGHAWSGPGDAFNRIADKLSEAGYIGFAIDVYGKGVRGGLTEDNSHLMNPLLENRALLRQRMLAAFKTAQDHPLVLKDKIAVMGHCFGGLCALDLARANPEGLRGAISIHGILSSPGLDLKPAIDSSVLVLHGWEDPVARPQSVLDFAKEMTAVSCDWQIHSYGHAMHAFTFPGADIPELGIRYNEKAHHRAEKAAADFLVEVFR